MNGWMDRDEQDAEKKASGTRGQGGSNPGGTPGQVVQSSKSGDFSCRGAATEPRGGMGGFPRRRLPAPGLLSLEMETKQNRKYKSAKKKKRTSRRVSLGAAEPVRILSAEACGAIVCVCVCAYTVYCILHTPVSCRTSQRLVGVGG